MIFTAGVKQSCYEKFSKCLNTELMKQINQDDQDGTE